MVAWAAKESPMKNPGHRKRKQELGELILKLRTEKDLSRGDLIGLCHKRKSELNPDYDYNEVPNETWLARLERGEGAIYTLQQIDLLIAALDATSRQRVETLLVAELPIFA